ERLEQRWRSRHARERRGGIGILSGDADIKVLGLNMRDLEFPDLRSISETRICAAFGVPPILVGAKVGMDRSTYANYQEARRSFWEETVSPLLRRLQDRINHKLLPMFGDVRGLEARFDKSEVSALQESVDKLWERVTRAVEAGWLLLDEARAEAGKDALPDGQGQVRLVRSGVTEVPVGATEGGGTPGGTAPAAGSEAPAGARGSGEPEEPQEPQEPQEPGGGPGEPAEGQPAPTTTGEPEARQRGPTRLLKAREEIAQARQRLADRYEQRWREWAAEEFRQEARDVLRAFSAATKGRRMKSLSDEELIQLLTVLYQLNANWRQRIQDSVMDLALEHVLSAAGDAGSELDVAFDLDNEYARRFVQQYVFPFAQTLADGSVDRVRRVILAGQQEGLTVAEMRNRLLDEFDDWTVTRAEMVARTETIRASNAGALMAYRYAGVQMVEWLPAGDACPYCKALEGKRWAAGSALFDIGDEWHPEGVERPFRITYEPVRHPPLHPHCRCTLVPVVE
ncbi:MAG: phage portal protein, partial [Bacillota bacterium]